MAEVLHQLDGTPEEELKCLKQMMGLREDQSFDEARIDDEGNLLDENGNIIEEK